MIQNQRAERKRKRGSRNFMSVSEKQRKKSWGPFNNVKLFGQVTGNKAKAPKSPPPPIPLIVSVAAILPPSD